MQWRELGPGAQEGLYKGGKVEGGYAAPIALVVVNAWHR